MYAFRGGPVLGVIVPPVQNWNDVVSDRSCTMPQMSRSGMVGPKSQPHGIVSMTVSCWLMRRMLRPPGDDGTSSDPTSGSKLSGSAKLLLKGIFLKKTVIISLFLENNDT